MLLLGFGAGQAGRGWPVKSPEAPLGVLEAGVRSRSVLAPLHSVRTGDGAVFHWQESEGVSGGEFLSTGHMIDFLSVAFTILFL